MMVLTCLTLYYVHSFEVHACDITYKHTSWIHAFKLTVTFIYNNNSSGVCWHWPINFPTMYPCSIQVICHIDNCWCWDQGWSSLIRGSCEIEWCWIHWFTWHLNRSIIFPSMFLACSCSSNTENLHLRNSATVVLQVNSSLLPTWYADAIIEGDSVSTPTSTVKQRS